MPSTLSANIKYSCYMSGKLDTWFKDITVHINILHTHTAYETITYVDTMIGFKTF